MIDWKSLYLAISPAFDIGGKFLDIAGPGLAFNIILAGCKILKNSI